MVMKYGNIWKNWVENTLWLFNIANWKMVHLWMSYLYIYTPIKQLSEYDTTTLKALYQFF